MMNIDDTLTVVGAFNDINTARMTVDELHMAGFDEDEVFLVEPEANTAPDAARQFMNRLIASNAEQPVAPVGAVQAEDESVQLYLENLRQEARPVVVVRSADDMTEAVTIMRSNGAEIEGRVGPWLDRQRQQQSGAWRQPQSASLPRSDSHPM